MAERPIEFCAHLARAIAQGHKTVSWKIPLGEPYAIGDVLWVKEPWAVVEGRVNFLADLIDDGYHPHCPVTTVGGQSADTLKREYARLVLDVTDVTTAPLQTCDEVCAVACGMLPPSGRTALEEFKLQWDLTYSGKYKWRMNPVCVKLTFTKRT